MLYESSFDVNGPLHSNVTDIYYNLLELISLFVKVITTVLERTSSGGFCANDGIVHMTLPGLPFGGVGKSE